MDAEADLRTQAFGRREYPRVSCKNEPFFKRVKCKAKRFCTIVYRGFKHSPYLQTIIIFLLIILIVNIYLMYNGHFDEDGERPDLKTAATNGLYFTTTQFTTIGYGDMSPKSKISKLITSGIHLSILYIELKLAEEFGILNNPQKLMERNINETRSNSIIPNVGNEEKSTKSAIIVDTPVQIVPLNRN